MSIKFKKWAMCYSRHPCMRDLMIESRESACLFARTNSGIMVSYSCFRLSNIAPWLLSGFITILLRCATFIQQHEFLSRGWYRCKGWWPYDYWRHRSALWLMTFLKCNNFHIGIPGYLFFGTTAEWTRDARFHHAPWHCMSTHVERTGTWACHVAEVGSSQGYTDKTAMWVTQII